LVIKICIIFFQEQDEHTWHFFTNNVHHILTNIFVRGTFRKYENLDPVLEKGGIWHLWQHSWEIDRYEIWLLLRDALKYAKVNGRKYGAEYVTNGMLVGY
jgi:hypothetical protein